VVGAGIAATGGAATTAAAGGGTALALKAGGTTSLFGIGMKWLGIGAVSGLVTMGAAVGVEHTLETRAPSKLPSVTATAGTTIKETAPKATRTQAVVPATEEPIAPDPPRPIATNAPAPAVAAAAPSGEPSIAAEVAAIDEARSALSSGNAAKVASALDTYDRLPGPHRLAPEALYLRMEAAARSGNTAAARASAERLLATSPNGPHAARARQVLGL
jgi:hypothetical protein